MSDRGAARTTNHFSALAAVRPQENAAMCVVYQRTARLNGKPMIPKALAPKEALVEGLVEGLVVECAPEVRQ